MTRVTYLSDPVHPHPNEDFLNAKNLQFFASLGPTLAYILALMLAGVAGNSVVFAVYYKRFKPSVTRSFILAMSVCDLLTDTLSFPADVLELRFHNTFTPSWACKLSRTVKSSLSFMSACILMSVAMDRHRRMCRPHARPITLKHVKIALGLCAAVAAVITAPYTVLTGSQTVRYPGTNATGFKCSIDDRYVKSTFLVVYNAATGLLFILSFLAMVVAYARIAHQLWRHKRSAGISVTGRAVCRTGGGTNGAHVHTYTDQETTADRLDRSAGDTTEDLSVVNRERSYPDFVAAAAAAVAAAVGRGGDKRPASADGSPDEKPQRAAADEAKPSSSSNFELSDGRDANSAEARTALENNEDSEEPADVADETDVDSGLPSSTPDSPKEETSAGVPVPDSSLTNTNTTSTATTTNSKTTTSGDNAGRQTETATTTAAKDCCCFGHADDGKRRANRDPNENDDAGLATFSDNEDTLQPVDLTNVAAEPEDRPETTSSRVQLHADGSLSKKPSHTPSFLAARNYVSKWRKDANGGVRKKSKGRASVRRIPTRTTFMMFVLTVIFVLNYLPYIVVVSLRVRMELLVERLGLNVYHVLIRSYFIHSAVNPLVYSFCSAKFRQECRRLFSCRNAR